MTEINLERYARHIVLREIGGPGQRRLQQTKVALIGAGGLGGPVLQYLVAAGIGELHIIDDDVVSLSNLQRQVLYQTEDIGLPKADCAAKWASELNQESKVIAHKQRFTADTISILPVDVDILIDASDNSPTRRLINQMAVQQGIPLVFGAIGSWEGQVCLFDPAKGGPCYNCLFPEDPAAGLAPGCAEMGVVGALTGVIGSMMALEAIKYIVQAGTSLKGRLLLYDGLTAYTQVIGFKKQNDCPICSVGAG